jgi:hypothetical protein
MSSIHDLKVDIYVLDAQQGARALAVVNFNIPQTIVSEEGPRYQTVLGDAADFIDNHLHQGEAVSFQVSATYYLRNSVTGAERVWTGSFNYTSADFALLSGPDFLPYERDFFITEIVRCTTDPQHVASCLQWTDKETDWTFVEVCSVIVSCQALLSRHDEFFERYNLIQGGRHTAQRATVFHPW